MILQTSDILKVILTTIIMLVVGIIVFFVLIVFIGLMLLSPSDVQNIEEIGASVTVDSYGNVYVTGESSGTVDFDPGPREYSHQSDTWGSPFLSKFDSSGNFQWVKIWNGEGKLYGGIADKSQIIISGSSYGTVDLDPGPEVDEHIGYGEFLSRFDANGDRIWAKTWDGGSIGNIAVDTNGGIYTYGDFHAGLNESLDLDPGPGVVEINEPTAYVTKFDSQGEFIWAKTLGWMEGDDIAVDSSGDIYLTGIFDGTKDFDPGPGVVEHTGYYSAFLCKLDLEGNFSWVRTFERTGRDAAILTTIDPNSNILVHSAYPLLSNSELKENIFLKKFDLDGNLLWECDWHESDNITCRGIDSDDYGNIYITGYFTGKADFDPGPGKDERITGDKDVYLSKIDPSGNFKWAKILGGPGSDVGIGICFDSGGFVYVTGNFCDRVDFDPSPGEDWHTSTGYNDIFLSKFDLDGNLIWARTWGGENPSAAVD